MSLIGQTKLLNQVDKMLIGDFPQFIVLQGDRGCGKTLLSNYIADKLNAYVSNIVNAKLDDIRDIITDSNTLSHNKVYLIQESEKLNIQSQNAILKLVEEPPKHTYIIMELTNIDKVLTTIQSRAKVLTFSPYTSDNLRLFTDDNLLLSIYTTPGQILNTEANRVQELHDFAKRVLNNITKISILNLFNITTYINVNKKTDGFELDEFFNMFTYLVNNNIRNGKHPQTMIRLLKEINDAKQLCKSTGVNKLGVLDITLLNIRHILEEM